MTVLVYDTAVNVSVAAKEMNELTRETAIEFFARIVVLEVVDNDDEKAVKKAADEKDIKFS